MGSTLHVKLCPHKVWRAKYGCSKCDALELSAYERTMKPVPDSPTSDPHFDSDPDDGGD